MKSLIAGGLILFCALAPMRVLAQSLTPDAPSAAERRTAELLRAWQLGRELPATPAYQYEDSPAQAIVDEWQAFSAALYIENPDWRESALRAIYKQTDRSHLRGVILRRISEDPDFRSRQARFIRRYGFYANWVNRLFYSANRAVQGNLQAGLKLVVDAVFDLFRPAAADPAARRVLDLERRLRLAESDARSDPKQIEKLQRAVQRALAEEDLARAEWALHAGDAEAATYYASQAESLQPEWGKPRRLRETAEREAARRRRESLASEQVGYPDRVPRVDLAESDLLRDLILGRTIDPKPAINADRLVLACLADLPSEDQPRSTMRRLWPRYLRENPRAPRSQRAWVAAMVLDPDQNPDERLTDAEARRRGQLLRFIFLGPQRTRERVYQTSSWVTESLDALQNVGFFYVFEVIARGVQAGVSPPAPADEVIDAQAAWLRGMPPPLTGEAIRVARDLADQYRRAGRLEDARRLYAQLGLLGPALTRKLDVAEARSLLSQAAAWPEGREERKALVARARGLSSRLADDFDRSEARRRRRMETDEPPKTWRLGWDALQSMTKLPLPCGLPGDAAWFDGEHGNGEITMDGLHFAAAKADDRIDLSYFVLFEEEPKIFVAGLTRQELAPALREWLDLSRRQDVAARQTIEALHRLPVPFELQGGAGASGVDFYPRLKPLEPSEGEMDLYR